MPDQPSIRHPSLRTDQLGLGLKGKAVRGGAITVGVQVVRTLVDLAAGMVMARLLTPSDYGLVAMVLPVTGLIALFKDMGFSAATIQKEEINEAQVSLIFWINIAVAVLLALECLALSPLVGRFYGDARTATIMMALAGTFILSGLITQHQALLTRQMRFGRLAAIDMAATLARAATGVTTAWLGWSYWSIVAMSISGIAVNGLAVWMAEAWRPGRPAGASGMRAILGFGSCLTASRLCLFVAGNADKLLIGKLLGAAPLGLYNRGFQLLLLPVEQIYTPASSVMLSTLSRVAAQPARFRKAVRDLAELMLLTITPVTAILLVLAPETVRVLLGPAWMEAVPVFRGLALAAVALPVNYLCGIILQTCGRTDVLMRWSVVTMAISVISIVIGLRWGVVGVAYAWSAGVLLLRTPGFYLTVSRNTVVSFGDLLKPVLVYAFPFALLIGCGTLLRPALPLDPPWLFLFVHGALLAALYVLYLLARGRHRWLSELLQSLKPAAVPAPAV
jgi:PST family polysaccharide transporter